MNKKLIYLPLEPYLSRYTWYMSCPGGWAEDHFTREGVPFVRVEGKRDERFSNIGLGFVLDGYQRSTWALAQIAGVVDLVRRGGVGPDDWIYTEDFYHPGIDALFYLRSLLGATWKVGCFIHAQTLDSEDFTSRCGMEEWMRPIEVGMSHGYDAIFTCSPLLKELAVRAGYRKTSLHVSGLPFNSSSLVRTLEASGLHLAEEKKPQVLFSSRLDPEKNPHFFLSLVERMKDVSFVLCKPRPILCRDNEVRIRAESLPNLTIVDTSEDKLSYYQLLVESKVQFNCALQDWVSWTLVEAACFGCNPVYPIHRDFPFELAGNAQCLYEAGNLQEAEEKIRLGLVSTADRAFLDKIVSKHDNTWSVQLGVMGF